MARHSQSTGTFTNSPENSKNAKAAAQIGGGLCAYG